MLLWFRVSSGHPATPDSCMPLWQGSEVGAGLLKKRKIHLAGKTI